MHRQMLVVDCSWKASAASFTALSLGLESHIVASLGLPQTNVLAGQTDNVALVVHDACSCTSSTDIDPNVVVDLRTELIVRVDRHLSGLLSRRVAIWKTTGARHGGQLVLMVIAGMW